MSEETITIKETDEGIEVDLFPDMLTTTNIRKEPLRSNPNIKIDIGEIGGKPSPLKVYYPKDYNIDDVVDRANKLASKRKHCPVCERKKRELLSGFQRIAESDAPEDEKKDSLKKELVNLREKIEGWRKSKEDVDSSDMAPVEPEEETPEPQESHQEPIPLRDPPSSRDYHQYWFDRANTRTDDARESVQNATKSVENLFNVIFTPPKILTPAELFEKARQRYRK